jgi:hypothetical protein
MISIATLPARSGISSQQQAEIAQHESAVHSMRRRSDERLGYDEYVSWILREVSR